ncbi:MAG: MmgE/PrpD family protein, partial [Dehalococcoidia bacterium]
DLMIRLGYALDPHGTLERGFHPTGVCGIFGAVVTAARLLGLDTQATTWALGIAGSQTAGSMEYLAQGSWTKRMHPGWAAHSGILAALLAREGFTGPSTIFEGRDGFFHGYSSASEPPRALEELGELFFITRCTIKPYASCRYTHGPIDCLLRLKREHGIRPQEIAQVTVPVLKAGWNIVVAPEERKRDPQSIVDAQFSMPFGAAVALLYSHAFLEEYSEERLSSPEVREMMDKVRCVQDPALEEHFPARWPAWAEIETRDGRRFSTRTDYPKGDPENPLTWDELKGKFCALAGLVFSPKRQEEVIVRVEELEGLRDVRELASLVRTR